MKQCEFCGSRKTKRLNETLFCENCEIYFALKNGTQLIKSLPITETSSRSLKLCPSCTKLASKDTLIVCKTFREYLKKLPYCKTCKSLNLIFLKNLFFKNFLLYKKIRKIFGITTLFTLILTWIFLEDWIVLFYYYITMQSTGLPFSKLIVTAVIFYNLNRYAFIRFWIFLLCLYRVLTRKTIYFDVPINLLNVYELDNFIDRLSLNGPQDLYRSKKQADRRYDSLPHIKSI